MINHFAKRYPGIWISRYAGKFEIFWATYSIFVSAGLIAPDATERDTLLLGDFSEIPFSEIPFMADSASS